VRSLILVAVVVLVGCSAASPTLTLAADRSTGVAGTDTVSLVATVTGANGSPVQDFVDFTVTAGGQLSDARVKGNAAGVSTTKLTASSAGALTVTASVAGASSASTTVTFSASGAPHLRFQTSPSNTMTQNLLRPIPAVVVEDTLGTVTSSTASVTVAITPGSCSATLDASSLTTVSATAGVASFYGLKSSTAATGCTLTATSSGLQAAVSTSFDLL
jgi:hypothetical protein